MKRSHGRVKWDVPGYLPSMHDCTAALVLVDGRRYVCVCVCARVLSTCVHSPLVFVVVSMFTVIKMFSTVPVLKFIFGSDTVLWGYTTPTRFFVFCFFLHFWLQIKVRAGKDVANVYTPYSCLMGTAMWDCRSFSGQLILCFGFQG